MGFSCIFQNVTGHEFICACIIMYTYGIIHMYSSYSLSILLKFTMRIDELG